MNPSPAGSEGPPFQFPAISPDADGTDAGRSGRGSVATSVGTGSGANTAAAQAFAFALEAPPLDPEVAGAAIGSYELRQKLGEGGFGSVWLAEQREPLRRLVALKIIKRGMDTREVIVRFEAERQALARMEHPNIARVLDAGETVAGRPYFVMELVRGVPITQYCSAQRLSLDARLGLFVAICHGVQHAHQKGVIHRDLKPSNILVTLHDGAPVPKIIDFGIAKATAGALTDRTLFTQFETFLGTPAYTSPEQMEMSGLDVDTRSDLYSLGVLLYELLIGRPPFDPDELRHASFEQMRKIIREREPLPPSRRLATLEAAVRHTSAEERGLEPVRLISCLRGDLDWIVMRCLEKDRTRRYASASDLAGDVRRFLDQQPVEARPPSAAYQLAKFVRRHRVGVTTGALIALAITASAVVSTIALVRESQARQREAALHAEASRAAARSDQIARFMKDMIAGVDPVTARDRDTILLREILASTARRIDTELREQPEVAAELRTTLAGVYTSLGDYRTAETLLVPSIAAFRAATPARPAGLATALEHYCRALKLADRRTEALAAGREAVALFEQAHGRRHLATASALLNLSRVMSHGPEFRAVREEVFAIYAELLPPDSPELASALFGLGTATFDADRVRGAELHRQSLAIRRRVLDRSHPHVAESLHSVSLHAAATGRWDEARRCLAEALGIRRRALGESHPETVSSLVRLFGLTPATEAEATLAQAAEAVITASRTELPRARPMLAVALTLRATLHEQNDRTGEAASLHAEALAQIAQAAREGTPIDNRLYGDLRIAREWKFAAGRYAEAGGLMDAHLAFRRGLAPKDSNADELRTIQFFRGLNFYFAGRFAEAADSFQEVLSLSQPAPEPNDVRPQYLRALCADSLLLSGRAGEAEALLEPFRGSVDGKPAPPNTGPSETLSPVLYQLGRNALQRGDLAAARTALELARQRAPRPPAPIVQPGTRAYPPVRYDSAGALVLARQGDFAAAEPLRRAALAEFTGLLGHPAEPPAHVIEEIRANLAEADRLTQESAP